MQKVDYTLQKLDQSILLQPLEFINIFMWTSNDWPQLTSGFCISHPPDRNSQHWCEDWLAEVT